MNADENGDCAARCVARQFTGLSNRRFHRPSWSKVFKIILFGKIWLTIQNTTTSQARSLFRVAGVFISFCPWRALLLLWQLRICAAAAARRHPTPPLLFLGGEVPKK